MKRVIITGATGFIGANLVRRLLYDGHNIHLLVPPEYNTWRIAAIRTDVHIYEVDFTDGEALIRIVANIRPDWVFHLAAHGAYSWQTDIRQMVQTNIIGTINLVEACLKTGFEVLVNTGSSSEYGFKDHAPHETEWLEPNSYYAVTKASATLFCRYIAQSRNVHLPTLRLYSVYGPYEEPTRLMPTLILRALNGELPPMVNPDIARDYTYIEDVSEAYILAATRSKQELGAVYNVGTGIQTTLREVVKVVRHMFNITADPKWGSMGNRIWDTNTWISNNHYIREALGWYPRYNFERGFRKMVDWFRDNPSILEMYTVRNKSNR